MKRLPSVLALLFFLIVSGHAVADEPTAASSQPLLSWIVYYADKEPAETFYPYDLVVFDSDYHPPIRSLVDRGKTVIGYLNLGEAEKRHSYFKKVKEAKLTLSENPDWPGSYFVDVRDPLWAKMVIEELIPGILHQGFNGIFLDTLDNPAELERRDPKKYAGMTEASARLVKAIRRNYPDITIMMNRGYEILPEVALYINIVLGESIYSDYDFKTKVYKKVKKEEYQEQVVMLNDAQKRNPNLRILTLDYWYPDDHEGLKEIYQEEKKNGFSPYVSTVDLDKVIPPVRE